MIRMKTTKHKLTKLHNGVNGAIAGSFEQSQSSGFRKVEVSISGGTPCERGVSRWRRREGVRKGKGETKRDYYWLIWERVTGPDGGVEEIGVVVSSGSSPMRVCTIFSKSSDGR